MSLERQDIAPEVQAAEWMALRRSGQMSELQARAFARWLDADPANRGAFDELQLIWDEAGEVREDPAILALREQNLRTFNRPGRMRLAAGALAASLAVAVLGGLTLVRPSPDAPPLLPFPGGAATPDDQVLSTGVGQTTTAVLKDGSTLVLDSDTLLRATETGRQRTIHLERGGAFFKVAKDPSRPFVVVAGGKTITALGTAFEARLASGKLDVTLVEGKVRVEGDKGRIWQSQRETDLVAGWRLTAADDDRKWAVQRVDTNKELSWLSGRLTFFNDPLNEAVAKINRYSERKILVDPAIAGAPIVGVFESGDTETFVRGMELAGIARVGRETETTVELVAPAVEPAS